MKRNTKLTLIITLAIMTVFTAYSLWADKALTERTFQIKSENIPSAFNGFRIVQVSDLHNATFGKNNAKLLEMIKASEPDIIAVTGDVIDSRRTNTAIATDFLKEALSIAPVYYVTGNHEFRIAQSESFIGEIKNLGVTVLENESLTLTEGTDIISLCGIADPTFVADYLFGDEAFVVAHHLEELQKNNSFTLLLSHRPEFFDLYAEYGFDLVLSGHAHGGQFRMPFVGGFIAPGQGLFPEYDSGLYEKDGTSMIVSRGLGNSIIPLRLLNRPEIITVVLYSD